MYSDAVKHARIKPWSSRGSTNANPSRLEYSHIGETAIRLRKVILRIVSGVNKPATVETFLSRSGVGALERSMSKLSPC
jgi:hypothetical protein